MYFLDSPLHLDYDLKTPKATVYGGGGEQKTTNSVFFPLFSVCAHLGYSKHGLLNKRYLFAWKYIRIYKDNFTVLNTPNSIKVPLSIGFSNPISENVEDITV